MNPLGRRATLHVGQVVVATAVLIAADDLRLAVLAASAAGAVLLTRRRGSISIVATLCIATAIIAIVISTPRSPVSPPPVGSRSNVHPVAEHVAGGPGRTRTRPGRP